MSTVTGDRPARRAPLPLIAAVLLVLAAAGGCARSAGRPAPAGSPAPASTPASDPVPAGTSGGDAAQGSTGSPSTGRSEPKDPTRDPAPAGQVPMPTIGAPSAPPKQPVDAFASLTTRGTVRVAGTCRLLSTETTLWTLVGTAVADLRDGEQVEVTGLPQPQEETGCAGGALHVRSVRRL